jgi:hypothetical protein
MDHGPGSKAQTSQERTHQLGFFMNNLGVGMVRLDSAALFFQLWLVTNHA